MVSVFADRWQPPTELGSVVPARNNVMLPRFRSVRYISFENEKKNYKNHS